ncbi:hypothetical protein BGX38DRAFT_1267070 [Terfezia claveryi]|nr:hypothetical protein BGX38DRAFT_1267070 [Terfezia claveryi]
MRDLLKEKTGKELRDPQQVVNALVTQFQSQIKKEEKESGTVQENSELKQSLFEWVAHLNEQQDQAKQTQLVKAEIEKEQNKAKKARANLLRTWSERDPSSSDSEKNEDTDIEEIPRLAKRSKTLKTRNSEVLEVVQKNGNRMAAAVEKLADAIASGSSSRVSTELLEAKVVKLEAYVEETN